MSNPYGITWDAPGFCALCHVAVAEFNGSDQFSNLLITKLLPTFRLVGFTLNTGSVLKVALCESCEQTITPAQSGPLMESVLNGWAQELERKAPHWTEEKKVAHMTTQAQTSITGREGHVWETAQLTTPRKAKLLVRI